MSKLCEDCYYWNRPCPPESEYSRLDGIQNRWSCFRPKEKKSIKQVFIKFLKEHGAYERFIVNWENSIMCGNQLAININRPRKYLIRSFWFEDSPEKYTYWNTLNFEWHKVCDRENV